MTRTEKYKNQRGNYLTEHQRDLITLELLQELPKPFVADDELVEMLVRRYHILRAEVEKIDMKLCGDNEFNEQMHKIINDIWSE